MTYHWFQVVKDDFQEGKPGVKEQHSEFRSHTQNIFTFYYLHVSLLWSSKQNIKYHSPWLRKKKRISYFRWKPAIYMGNVLKWFNFAKFLAPCVLIRKLGGRPRSSFQIHKISNGHELFPIRCRLLFLVWVILCLWKVVHKGKLGRFEAKDLNMFSQLHLFTKEWINSEPGFLWRFRLKQLSKTDEYTSRFWNLFPEPIVTDFPKL